MISTTVLTSTYNREKEIHKLYNSLCEQTDKNFVWTVVDDGSLDNTKETINKFINEGKIKINYLYQTNMGKHKAINRAVRTIKTPLIFIVDSDDYLTKNAIERIDYYYEKYKNNGSLCGFSFLRMYSNGQINDKKFPKEEMVESYIEARINRNIGGDKAEVFYTRCLKEFPFPEYENEKFISEAVSWIEMAKKYKMVNINEAIYVGDYLEEGLTKNIKKHKIFSPLGYMDYAKELASKECNVKSKLKGILLYGVYGKFANKNYKELVKNIQYKSVFTFLYPMAIGIYIKWRKENK